MNTLHIILFAVSNLASVALGMYAFKLGARMSFYADRGFHMPNKKVSAETLKKHNNEQDDLATRSKKRWDYLSNP